MARGQSILVSAPTSTGKTLIGWWGISTALAAGRRAVYLVSHRALAKQKFEEAQRLFLANPLGGDRASIVCATGDGVEDGSGRKTNAPLSASILIATYEKFLGCLSVGGPPRDLTDVTFVCDEIQLIGDPHRGKNVELLLTLLRRSGWQQLVALSAVLGEPDAQSLAAWLELVLVRNPTREKALRIECRSPRTVYELTAGPNHISEINEINAARELSTINIVNEIVRIQGQAPVIVFCMKVDNTHSLCEEWIRGRRDVEAVETPPGVDLDVALRQALARRAAFHNAELSEEERIFVEQRVAAGAVDVVFATTTLAAGVNFPLSTAIFASWKRWNQDRRREEPIGRAEFQNMAGRVGRMGQAAEVGQVILTTEAGPSVNQAIHLMNLGVQDELGLGIEPADLGGLTLQLFAGRLCSSRADAFDLLASTLSAAREIQRNAAGIAHWEPLLNAEIDRLIRVGCLTEGRAGISVTSFGVSVARSGMKPETALFFVDGLVRTAERLAGMLPSANAPGAEDDLLFVFTHAALTSPEFTAQGGAPTRSISWRVSRPNLIANPFARRLGEILWDQPWAGNVAAANGALLIASWASGSTRANIEQTVPGVRLGTVEALSRDVAWILTGVSEIITEATSPTLADESKPEALRGNNAAVQGARKLARAMRRQAMRVSLGLPSDSMWMANLDLRGPRRRLTRTQILSLRFQGLSRPHDLMDGGLEADRRRRLALPGGDGNALSNLVRDAARNWKISDRNYFQRVHIRRADRLGIREEVQRLYDTRGNDFENAFEQILGAIGVQFENLDRPPRQARPDYLVTIENFPPLVFELKSRAADTDLVTLNGATEVLAASELHGLRDRFCVTLCNPGVDPSVPRLVEECGRLCVVDVCDLVEAVIRIREGSLTRDGLYNWLTAPGIALMDDLPHPV